VTEDRKNAEPNLPDLDLISEIVRETLSSLKLGTTLHRIVDLLLHRFDYDDAAVALVEGDWVVFRAGSTGERNGTFPEPTGEHTWRVPMGEGLVGRVAASGKVLQSSDIADPHQEASGFDFPARPLTELAVPLIHQGEVIGVLNVRSHRGRTFTEGDVRVMEIVAGLVAPAIHIGTLYEQERRRIRHLKLISEISQIVVSSLDRDHVINTACQEILEALDVTFAGIALVDKTRSAIVHLGHASMAPLVIDPLKEASPDQGMVARVISTGESMRLGDVRAFDDFIDIVPGMKSALCVPLRLREEVIGAVDVEHSLPNYFTDQDEELLTSLAVFLSQAMENAQLFENQLRRWQQLLVINEMARVATESFDLDEILHLVAREIHDRFNYFCVAVSLREDREVIIKALQCEEELKRGIGHRENVGFGIMGRVAKTGKTFMALKRGDFETGSALDDDIQSVLCIPLHSRDKNIGVIQVQSRMPSAFNADDLLVLETLAKSVAGAIANALSIRQAEQFREDLNRMIVHDLRSPMHAVLLTLQEVSRAAEERSLPPALIEAITEGESRAESILEMISGLLDVSRFEAGKAQVRLAPAALNDHIRSVVRRVDPLVRSKRITVQMDLSSEVPVLWMDHELVNRALDNLIGNAVKYTPNGGQVTIRDELVTEPRPWCPTSPPYVRVSITDTGEGIPAEFHDKIFEKFGQVDSRRAGLEMSTGLGLALCRYVVNAHGGVIWVESAPGRGSTFHFTLQVHKKPPSGGYTQIPKPE